MSKKYDRSQKRLVNCDSTSSVLQVLRRMCRDANVSSWAEQIARIGEIKATANASKALSDSERKRNQKAARLVNRWTKTWHQEALAERQRIYQR